MKRLLCAMMAVAVLAGCGQTKKDETAASPAPETAAETAAPEASATPEATATPEAAAAPEESAEPEQPAGGALLGGWTTSDLCVTALTDEEKQLFETAKGGLLGVDYTPVQVLATQVVSGTNYAYLLKGTTVTKEPVTSYYIGVVYKDLSDNAELTALNVIDPADLKTVADTEEVLGGWQVTEGIEAVIPDENLQAAFASAKESLLGVDMEPIAVLGTQVVNGTNALVLSRGHAVAPDAPMHLYVTKLTVGTDGKVEVMENTQFDLPSYTQAEVKE